MSAHTCERIVRICEHPQPQVVPTNVTAARRKVREHLGRCLALARAYARLSQAEVAQQLGIRRATISLWETGEREPGAVDLLRLAVRSAGWGSTRCADGWGCQQCLS